MKTMMRLLIHTFHIACFIFAWTSLGLCIQLNSPKQLTVSEGKLEKKVRVEWVVLDVPGFGMPFTLKFQLFPI